VETEILFSRRWRAAGKMRELEEGKPIKLEAFIFL